MAWVWFFIPLPQPLGFPDGFVYRQFEDPAPHEMRQSSEIDRGLAATAFDPRLRSSVLIRRRLRCIPLDSRITPLLDAAEDAFPNPDLESERHASFDADIQGDMTVAEVAVYVDEPSDSDQLSDAYDKAFESVRAIQEAYGVATNVPVSRLTMGKLPSVVPYVIGSIDVETGQPSMDVDRGIFSLSPAHLSTVVAVEELEGVALAKFQSFLQSSDNALWPYAKQRSNALSLIEFDGDAALGAVVCATAGQLLLDIILRYMLWESGEQPEVALRYFADVGLRTRAKRDFHGRLGGDWSVVGDGPVAAYFEHTAGIRHRIVHSGYEPTISEARKSYSALLDLDRFVASRLYARWRDYPRTALLHLGQAGFERREGRTPRRLEALMHDNDEPPWAETFERWSWVLDDLLSPRSENHEIADLEIVIVVRRNEVLSLVHNCKSRRAARYSVDVDDEVASLIENIQREQNSADSDVVPEVVIRIANEPGLQQRVGGWMREHELIHSRHLLLDDAPWRR